MTWIIISSIVFTVISLFLIVVGLISDDDSIGGSGIFILVFTVIVGWGILGNILPISYEYVISTPSEIANTKFTVFVKYEDRTLSSTDAKFVNAPIDKIRVKKTIDINSYGKEIPPSSYELIIQD